MIIRKRKAIAFAVIFFFLRTVCGAFTLASQGKKFNIWLCAMSSQDLPIYFPDKALLVFNYKWNRYRPFGKKNEKKNMKKDCSEEKLKVNGASVFLLRFSYIFITLKLFDTDASIIGLRTFRHKWLFAYRFHIRPPTGSYILSTLTALEGRK